MDAACTIQDSIHVFSLVRKYVSRILGTYHRRWGFYLFYIPVYATGFPHLVQNLFPATSGAPHLLHTGCTGCCGCTGCPWNCPCCGLPWNCPCCGCPWNCPCCGWLWNCPCCGCSCTGAACSAGCFISPFNFWPQFGQKSASSPTCVPQFPQNAIFIFLLGFTMICYLLLYINKLNYFNSTQYFVVGQSILPRIYTLNLIIFLHRQVLMLPVQYGRIHLKKADPS